MRLQDDLTTAAARGDTAGVERLLRAGADPNGVNGFGNTALQVMMMGSSPVARVLLEGGADTKVAHGGTGRTPLHDAAEAGFQDTVGLLVRYGADPRARDLDARRPVDLARLEGHDTVVHFLEHFLI